jgi:hypothetical protein
VPKANTVKKIRDHGYIDLGYSGFVNNVGMNREWMPPTKGDMGCFAGKKKAIKGDDEKAK